MGCTRALSLLASLVVLLAATAGCVVPEDMPALREELGYASVDRPDLVVKARASTQTPTIEEPVTMRAEVEGAPLDAVELRWEVDGSTYEDAEIEVSFTQPGDHPVRLEAAGPNGTRAVDEITVEARPNEAPEAQLHVGDADELWSDEPVTLRAEASDPDGDELSYTWQLDGETREAGAVLEAELAPGPHDVAVTVSDGHAEVTREQAFAVDHRIEHQANLSFQEPEAQVTVPLAEGLDEARLQLTHTTLAGLEQVNLTVRSPDGEAIASTTTDPDPGASQASEELTLGGEALDPRAHTLVVTLEQGTESVATIEGVFMYSPLPSPPG